MDSLGGGCHTGCRWRCRLVCVRVRRSKTRLSDRQGVVGVVWSGLPGRRQGCHTACRWRCNLLMCVWVRVCRSKTGLLSHRVSLKLSSDACPGEGSQHYFFMKMFFFCLDFFYAYFGLFLAQKFLWKKMYLVNRLQTNCRKSLIPFPAIWGLCWFHLIGHECL